MNKVIGQKIKKLRLEKGLNQNEFAAAIHVTQASLSLYENGNKLPSINVLVNVAKYFNVSIDWLCDISPELLCDVNSAASCNSVSATIRSFLEVLESINKDFSVKVCDTTISFDFSAPSDNDTENSVSAEITSFFKEYAEMKKKLSSLPDKEFSDFAKDYYDMWLEKKLAYYASMPVHTKNEDV